MREAPAQRLSRWLVFLLILLLCLDVLITPFTPAFAYFRSGAVTDIPLEGLMNTFAYDFDDGLGNLLRIILSEAWKEPYTAVLALFLLVCGVCGEHGGDPDSIHTFNKIGLDYVSCSPYRVPVARLAAAQAALEEE